MPASRLWKQSALDVVDTIVQFEKEWIVVGVNVEEKLAKNQ